MRRGTIKSRAPDIRLLFNPRSVAVIGASRDSKKIGYKIVQNMLKAGCRCRLHPVNPGGGEILGLPVARSIGEIRGGIDMAVISIPAQHVFSAVQACAAARVKFLVIVTSGFSEVGNQDEEIRIVAFARRHGMRVLGPNIFGIFSAGSSLNAGFAPADIRPGKVAIITQSGAMGGAMIGKTDTANIGLSALVPLGNKADIDEADLLDYFKEDPDTEIILIYIEGVKDGQRLIRALGATTRRKPVIVIKSGRSRRGAMAAASHTGALSGSDEVFSDLMRQCGVLRAEQLQDALDWCKFLGEAPRPGGENAVIITNGGGAGVSASDACEKYGVRLHDDFEMLEEAFSPVTPGLGSTQNPIDMTGQAGATEYEQAMRAALEEESVHTVIAVYCETALLGFEKLAGGIERIYKDYHAARKPVVFCLLGGQHAAACIERLRRHGVPAFDEIYVAISCLGVMYTYERHLRRDPSGVARQKLDSHRINAIIRGARADRRRFLLAHEGQAVLEAMGLAAARSRIARTIEEAVSAAEEIGYAVVLKVVSRDIIHKSDVGGVALDLENRGELLDAYQAVMHGCRRRCPQARIEGVEIAEMVGSGSEVIVGARRDPTFGPIVMFGLGGIYVEVLEDVSFRAVPLDRDDAMSMIKETRAHRLLLGVRGEEKRDLPAVVNAIITLASAIETCEDIADIEINPLSVYEEGQGVKAVDVRILLSDVKASAGKPGPRKA